LVPPPLPADVAGLPSASVPVRESRLARGLQRPVASANGVPGAAHRSPRRASAPGPRVGRMVRERHLTATRPHALDPGATLRIERALQRATVRRRHLVFGARDRSTALVDEDQVDEGARARNLGRDRLLLLLRHISLLLPRLLRLLRG